MIKFAVGFILGIFVATVGVKGVVNSLDKGVDEVKTQAQTLAK